MFFSDGPKAFEVLARRMEKRAELHVTLLLNIQRKRGDTSDAEQLVRRFTDRFWKTDWPGSSRPRVYYDPRALELDGPGSVLRAKAIVTDDQVVFLTSANLTSAVDAENDASDRCGKAYGETMRRPHQGHSLHREASS